MSSDPSIRPPAAPSIASAGRAPKAGTRGGRDVPHPVAARAAPARRARLAACALALGALAPAHRAGADAPAPGTVPGTASGAVGAEAAGPATLALPALANTAEGDRELLREVGDGHVHDGLAAGRHAGRAARAASVASPSGTPAKRSGPSPVGVPAGAERASPPGRADVGGAHGSATRHAGAGPANGPAHGSAVGAPATGAALAAPDVWARIRGSGRLPERGNLAPVAALREEYLAEGPWVTRILERGTPYLAHLVDELDRRFLPLGLALLPAIESGFRTDVESSGRALGLWQIVPITADEIGLERSPWFDARADILASTTAALDYLSYLNAEFDGDWELTLAAYNAGPGRVRGAIRRNANAGEPVDFWSLPLPPETRRYVPKVLALVSLLREDPSPIRLPRIGASGFERVDVGARISLDRAAALSGLPERLLRSLNAGLVHGVTAPTGPHALYLPRGESERFLALVAESDPDALYSLPRVHRVAPGETLSGIAHRYGLSQEELARLNALPDTALLAGQELAVLDVRRAGGVALEYVVGVGDTLSEIAESHAVGLEDISRADGSAIDGDVIHPGQTLSITVGAGRTGGDGTG